MAVKENFISLFSGHEIEINQLPDRFPIKDFTYMFTSQRTTEKIQEKLKQIAEGRAQGQLHGNFWVDLRNMGLVKINSDEISDFGKVMYSFLQVERDDFKREHFILSNIRQQSYDIDTTILQGYEARVNDFENFLSLIPPFIEPGKELINNPDKLLVTSFLNAFPYALTRYFTLSESDQRGIDKLHESGLRNLFLDTEISTPYYKVARRLWNVWRVPERRVYFVKSVILSAYEDLVEQGDGSQRTEVTVLPQFAKILNIPILKDVIRESGNLAIKTEGDREYIIQQSISLPVMPPDRRVRMLSQTRRKRKASVIIINGSNDLLVSPNDVRSKYRILSPEEQQIEIDTRLEKTREHQKIVQKFWEYYHSHGFTQLYQNNFDLVVKFGNKVILHEMKTNDSSNERIQIIKGIGQLFYYEYFDLPPLVEGNSSEIYKVIAFQKKPEDIQLVEYIKSLGILPLWIGDHDEVTGDDKSIETLNSLVRA